MVPGTLDEVRDLVVEAARAVMGGQGAAAKETPLDGSTV